MPESTGYTILAAIGMAQHDESYKLLFSHPEMVQDLLTGFVPEEWVRGLDFATLEKVSGSFVSDDLRDREADVIWRVRWRGAWLYIYLLIEFQRTIDPFMSVRLLGYRTLLYQDLIRSGALGPGRKLPPVAPIVLYNGIERWSAPLDVSEVLEEHPAGLERYRPRASYLVLDEGAFAEAELGSVRNLAAAVFRLENSRSLSDLRVALAAAIEWLKAPEQDNLRRAFTVWIKRVLLPARLPGIELPEVNDLQEVQAMLAERVMEWTKEWKQQGLQEGLQEGLQQGEAAVVTRQAEHRFGPLPRGVRERIEAADPETLLRWAENLLSAEVLEEIFD